MSEAADKRYRASPKGREANRARSRYWRETPERRAVRNQQVLVSKHGPTAKRYHPPASSDAVRSRMNKQATRDTVPELLLRRELTRLGLRYFVHRLLPIAVRCEADVVFPRKRVAVFVDGCMWHKCPEHWRRPKTNGDWWEAKVQRNRDRDARNDTILADEGWTVVRVWEHEPPAGAAMRVMEALA